MDMRCLVLVRLLLSFRATLAKNHQAISNHQKDLNLLPSTPVRIQWVYLNRAGIQLKNILDVMWVWGEDIKQAQ